MAILESLSLENFRNYEKLDLSFSPGMNIFVGENGQGKSNILEAIYFLSILRSFRTVRQKQLFRWGEKNFMIRGQIKKGSRICKLGLAYGEKNQRRIDGENIRRASDFIAQIFAVAFVPEDIELIKGTAGLRRRFMDITLSQIDSDYLNLLQQYNKAMKSRNQLLKQKDEKALKAYEDILLDRGCQLIRKRQQFFEDLGKHISPRADLLLPEGSQFAISYKMSVPDKTGDLMTDFKEKMAANRERDQRKFVTHTGPHRDDFHVLLNNNLLGDFGSEGQCRLAALTLKLAKADFLFKKCPSDSIILLVDDVIGELDERGRRAFFDTLKLADQTFLACTSLKEISGLEDQAHCFRVVAGQVEAEKTG